MENDLDSITWKHFRSSNLNRSGTDEEAKAMFDADKAQVVERDWTWYRTQHGTDDEARAARQRQRLRYGLPVD